MKESRTITPEYLNDLKEYYQWEEKREWWRGFNLGLTVGGVIVVLSAFLVKILLEWIKNVS